MKKITILLAGMLVSMFAFASEPGPGSSSAGLAVVKRTATTYNLYYKAASVANIKVKILNAAGEEVFSEIIRKTTGFIRPYNFQSLPEGEYEITTDDGSIRKSQKFNYWKVVKEMGANVVQLSSNKYLLAVKGQLVSGKIDVKIFDGATLVHKQQSDIHGDFGQLFTIKNISDAIKFEVTNSEGKKIN
jgi:uncharacterized protein YdeI (BOF family)